MPFLVSLFFGFVPMMVFAGLVYWLDRYEKEPRILLGAAFLWGVVIAAGGAFVINTVFGVGIYMLTGSEGAAEMGTTSIIAPIVEEFMKGLAVVIVFLMFYKEFDSVLDGIIYAGVTALGFAATENTLYIYRNGYLDGGWQGLFLLVFIRVIVVGWQHPFYTAFSGIGLALARMNKNLFIRLLAPLMGFGMAIATHSFHNTFAGLMGGIAGFAAGTLIDWFGWALMGVFIIWMIGKERNLMRTQLYPEVVSGVINAAQYQKATSPWTTSFAHLNGKSVARFYQACGELAHKKEQVRNKGDENGSVAIIESLRAELVALGPLVR